MKVQVEVSYYEDGMTHYPVVAYDENDDIDNRIITRIGTLSVIDGISIGTVLDALNEQWPVEYEPSGRHIRNKLDGKGPI